jgi:hypothetical protein
LRARAWWCRPFDSADLTRTSIAPHRGLAERLLLPLPFVLDNPSRVGTIGDTSYMTIQSHVVADSSDLAGFEVKTGASL